MKQVDATETKQNDHSDGLNFKKKGFLSKSLQYVTRPIKTAIKQFFFKKLIEPQLVRTSEERHQQPSTKNKQHQQHQQHQNFDPARLVNIARTHNSNKTHSDTKIDASLSR